MIGGVTRLGRLPGLPGRVTLSAGVAFCHVNDSRWGNPPSRGRVHARQSAPKFEPEQYGRPRLQTRRAFSPASSAERATERRKSRIFWDCEWRRSDGVPFIHCQQLYHATMSGDVTPGPRGCKFACRRGPFFDHGLAGYLTYLGSPTSM